MKHDQAILSDFIKEPLMNYCTERFDKHAKPCDGCRYRSTLLQADRIISCIFGDCPRDWDR